MTPLEHSVVIDRPLREVYALAQQVERYPEFLPGYTESRIAERRDDRLLLVRKAVVRGRVHEWQSWVQFDGKQTIRFEHAAGPLVGTRVLWAFSPVAERQTRLLLQHFVQVRRPGWIGWLMEKFFFTPRIDEMARSVVAAFKQACERI